MIKLSNKFYYHLVLGLSISCLVASSIQTVSIYKTVNDMNKIYGSMSDDRGSIESITNTMSEIKMLYDEHYIGEQVDMETLEDSALAGFAVGMNDKYGSYMSPSNAKKQEMERNEQLVGIGVQVVYESNTGFYVSRVYEESPASSAGIKKGDYIVSVEGEDITDSNKTQLLNNIAGEVGTSVTLGINCNGEVKSVTMERQNVVSKSVEAEIVDEVAYIKISSFTELTDEEFKEVMDKYIESGIDKFVIDLRGNTGGIADTVIEMADYMLPSGMIARFEFKNEENNIEYISDDSCVDGDVAILVNEYTASASELFSKSLQDYGKAIIVGNETYGKGTVISTYNLTNGGTITLSTAKYYTISGDELEGIGVKPDIEIDVTEGYENKLYKLPLNEDTQFLKAVEVLGD